jgi:membrane protease YdiL (CAAX protease family)
MLLGAILGYMFVWSGSIWIPIFVHFMNNAFAVVIAFLDKRGLISTDYESFGSSANPWIIILSFFIMLGLLLIIYWKREKPTPPKGPDFLFEEEVVDPES